MRIQIDDLSGPQVHALLQEHLDNMHQLSPPESVHALDLSKLRKPDITFWTVWEGDTLLGCGALKQLSTEHGEVKSMRTPAALRGRGAGRAVLEKILAEARSRGYRRLSLETGAHDAFKPAQALYRSVGFDYCGPFGDYAPDPNSVFMTLDLAASSRRQLAQLNIARSRTAIDDPAMAGFVSRLAEINALAEASPGFAWRYITPSGDDSEARVFGDARLLVNLSVWESIEALKQFVFYSSHIQLMKQRESWFERQKQATMVLWWVTRGHVPSLEEAKARLDHLRANGPSAYAFTFKEAFEASAAVASNAELSADTRT